MKKKILFAISLAFLMICLFAVSALAVEIDGIYYTLSGSGENATAAVNKDNATKCTLENVVIPSTVTYEGTTYTVNTIDTNAFSGDGWGKNQTIKTLYVPETVSSIGGHILRQCESIQSVTIKAKNANGITLGDAEFYKCYNLSYIDMSESDITSFNQYTFFECKALTSDGLKLPPRLTKIGSQSFRGCTSLTSLNLVDFPVTEIGSWALNGCSSLSSLKLPVTLVSIGGNCIQGTPLVGKLIFPDTFTTLSNDAIAQIPMYMVVFPDVSNGHSYHSGAFHDVYPTVIIYEGDDYTDLTSSIESFRGYTNALLFSEYDPNVTYTQRTIFYGAELCDKCNGILGDEKFNFTGYENEFYFASQCTNCEKETVSKRYDPMFTNLGFSASLYGAGEMSVNYKVNAQSILEYEKITGEAVNYGVFAVRADKIGTNDIFDADGNELSGVIAADITGTNFNLFSLKITGFTEAQKGIDFAMGAFVGTTKDGTTDYNYLQISAPENGEKYFFASYNKVLTMVPSDEDNV